MIRLGCGVGTGWNRPFGAEKRLVNDLLAILGSKILGLWIGEDIIVDGSGSVTSWPARIGNYPLTNSTANRFRTGATNGRRALAPGTIAEAKSLINADLPALRTIVAVAEGTPAVSSYEVIASRSIATQADTLARGVLTSSWYAGVPLTHYDAGLLNNSIPTSGLHVFEAEHESNASTGVGVGGWASGNRVWPVPIALVMALSSPMTSLQRARSLIALKQYYGVAILPQEQFAADIIEALGSHLNAFYTVDDAVLNGSSQVVSIPARTAGAASLTEYSGVFETRLRGNRRVMYAADAVVDRQLTGFPAVSPLVHSVLTVGAMVNLPFSGLSSVYRGAPVGDNNILIGNTGTSNWYKGNGVIRNSIDSQVDAVSAVCSSGLHMFGGWRTDTPTLDSAGWGGAPDGTGSRCWTNDLACVMQLKTRVADLPAATFQHVLDLCRAYYAGYWGA